MDFGCAEGKLLRYLIRNENTRILEQLVGVDIDGELIKENTFRIEPLLCDWLETREAPFTVSMLQGMLCDLSMIFTSAVYVIDSVIMNSKLKK